MLIERVSPITRKKNAMDIDVTQEQLTAWMNGALIQQAMPNVGPEEREFLISGITPTEWQDTFGEEE